MNSFFIPYKEDERMAYVGKYLKYIGYKEAESGDCADFIILPLPTKSFMVEKYKDKTMFIGGGNYKNTFDYCKDESFVTENAYLTSEGAVALCIEESDKAIYDSDVLVTGYGRIGKSLSKILSSMGANVTVCSRSDLSAVLSKAEGHNHIEMNDLSKPHNYDFIFNTVPHMIFTEKELKAVKKGTIIFDLASFPGGVDTLIATSLGVKLVDAKKLPKKYSPDTAGKLIAKTVDKMIRRGLY